MTDKTIAEHLAEVAVAEGRLEHARERLAHARAANTLVEELARRLMVRKIETEDDGEDLAQRCREDTAERDRVWLTLHHPSEHAKFREEAHELLKLTGTHVLREVDRRAISYAESFGGTPIAEATPEQLQVAETMLSVAHYRQALFDLLEEVGA